MPFRILASSVKPLAERGSHPKLEVKQACHHIQKLMQSTMADEKKDIKSEQCIRCEASVTHRFL